MTRIYIHTHTHTHTHTHIHTGTYSRITRMTGNLPNFCISILLFTKKDSVKFSWLRFAHEVFAENKITMLKNTTTFHEFINVPQCLTTGPEPLPKSVLHTVRSSVSSFNFLYPLSSLKSYSSCLRLLPRLSSFSILPCIFPSITCE